MVEFKKSIITVLFQLHLQFLDFKAAKYLY